MDLLYVISYGLRLGCDVYLETIDSYNIGVGLDSTRWSRARQQTRDNFSKRLTLKSC